MTERSIYDLIGDRIGKPVNKQDFVDVIRSSQASQQSRDAGERVSFSSGGIDLSSLLPNLSDEELEGLVDRFSLAAQEISKVSPKVLRDAHVISMARDYLNAEYAEVLSYLSTDSSEWFPHDNSGNPKEAKQLFLWNDNPLEDLSLIAGDMWRDKHGESAPTVSQVQVVNVQQAVDTLIAGWADVLGVNFHLRGPAAALERPAPVITTDKATQNINHLNDEQTEIVAGRSKALADKKVYITVTMGGKNPSPVALTATHTLVTDSLGALYRRHQDETGREHALFSLSQIVQQIMRTNKPTEEQQREVEQHIDELRQYNVEISGEDYDGNTIQISGNAVFAYKTVVGNKKGNFVTGYQLLTVPALFELSERQRGARQVDAILEPRRGGWKPPGIPGMTVYNVIARQLFQIHGSRFNPSQSYSIYYKTLQEKLGGDYSPETITPWRERTVRNYVEKSIEELHARGMISRFQHQYTGRKKMGIKIWLPKEFPDLKMSPDESLRLERR